MYKASEKHASFETTFNYTQSTRLMSAQNSRAVCTWGPKVPTRSLLKGSFEQPLLTNPLPSRPPPPSPAPHRTATPLARATPPIPTGLPQQRRHHRHSHPFPRGQMYRRHPRRRLRTSNTPLTTAGHTAIRAGTSTQMRRLGGGSRGIRDSTRDIVSRWTCRGRYEVWDRFISRCVCEGPACTINIFFPLFFFLVIFVSGGDCRLRQPVEAKCSVCWMFTLSRSGSTDEVRAVLQWRH